MAFTINIFILQEFCVLFYLIDKKYIFILDLIILELYIFFLNKCYIHFVIYIYIYIFFFFFLNTHLF